MKVKIDNPGSCRIAIFDLDGTLVDNDDMVKGWTEMPNEYWVTEFVEFFRGVIPTLTVKESVKDLLRSLYDSGYRIVISTSRSERYRSITEEWIRTEVLEDWIYVGMRQVDPSSDVEPSGNVKQKHIETLKQFGYRVENMLFFDDDPSVIDKMSEMGIQCFQVMPID